MRTTVNKALSAGLGAGLAGLGASMLDGQLTVPELVVAGGAALVAAAATWWVPYQVGDVNGRHEAP